MLIFDSVDSLYCNLQKTSLNRKGSSYIDSLEWVKNNKVIKNKKKKKNGGKCSPYALTTALNDQNIKSHPERISNLKPFIHQYNWKEIDFPSEQKD